VNESLNENLALSLYGNPSQVEYTFEIGPQVVTLILLMPAMTGRAKKYPHNHSILVFSSIL